MSKRIEFNVDCKIIGQQYDDESLEHAKARLALEAERFGNSGQARVHISLQCATCPKCCAKIHDSSSQIENQFTQKPVHDELVGARIKCGTCGHEFFLQIKWE